MCCLINIEDLRQLAMRHLPRLVFDYIDGGAEREITLREDCRAFDQVLLRRQLLRVVGDRLPLPVKRSRLQRCD